MYKFSDAGTHDANHALRRPAAFPWNFFGSCGV
jgi:hypothetical protein